MEVPCYETKEIVICVGRSVDSDTNFGTMSVRCQEAG
jgi:hypothetical protein